MDNKEEIKLTAEDSEEAFYFENKITKCLDEVYATINNGIESPVAVISGSPGSGKTSSVISWLEHNDYKYATINADEYQVLKTEITYTEADEITTPKISILTKERVEELLEEKTMKVSYILTPEQIAKLDKDTIVFIDNYDRADEEVRKALFTMVAKRCVVDISLPGKDRIRKIRPLMFIVVLDSWHCTLEKVLTEEEMTVFGM